MAGVALRRSTPDDVDEMLALFETVAAEGRWVGREAPLDRPKARQRFLDSMAGPGHYSTVAVAPGPPDRIVGNLHLGVEPYGVAELGMHITAQLRGQGIGRALLEDAIAWATAEPGVHKIALQVWPHNDAARGLYLACGFQQEGYLHQHYRRKNGDLWDAVVMGLLLR